jgi:hypothetical protein
MVTWTGRERLRGLWYRLRLTVAEMNYATRRTVEVQAPWITATAPAEPARGRTPSTSNQDRPLSSAAGDPPAIAKRHNT